MNIFYVISMIRIWMIAMTFHAPPCINATTVTASHPTLYATRNVTALHVMMRTTAESCPVLAW